MKLCKIFLFSSIFLAINIPNLLSVQIDPRLRIYRQPDGIEFQGRALGDEFVVFYETADGYSLSKNDSGWWCYAERGPAGRLIASEYRVHEFNPATLGLQKHLRHSDRIMEEIELARSQLFETLALRNPMKGYQLKKKQSALQTEIVEYNLAVLLIEFPDESGNYTPNDFSSLLFSQGFTYVSPSPGEPAYGSLYDYYHDASNGKLVVTGQVFDWVVADNNKDHYVNSDGYISEAVIKSGVDLDDFDGFVVIYAGSVGQRASKFWPRAGSRGEKLFYIMSEKWLPKYDFSPIGVHCHEFGHLLGLPDLYDPDFSSAGIGIWGLMGSGNFGNGHHERPFHLSVWSKQYLGWLSPTKIFDASFLNVELRPIEISREAVKLISRESYFLLENRQQIDYDLNLPGKGLLIWHVDERFGQQSFDQHRVVDLERADGDESPGDAGDPFPGNSSNTIFNATSVPGSHDYDGQSYVEVINITSSGENIQCDLMANLGSGVNISVNHEENFPSVFTAIEYAWPGDTVFVPGGTHLTRNILMKEGQVLRGEDSANTILDGAGGTIIQLKNVANTSISNITFTNAQTAIVYSNAGGTFSYNIIRNSEGSGIQCSNATPTIQNNTIINLSGTAINCLNRSTPTILNNIIAYNGKGISKTVSASPGVLYNNIWNNGEDYHGLPPGMNDISFDPLFANFLFNDYHLKPGSPCIDAGHPDAQYSDPDGSRNDLGALYFDIEYVISLSGIRVNAGGEAYSRNDSTYFAADQAYNNSWGYVGGNTGATTDSIALSPDDPLYQSERKNLTTYLFDIPNGRYRITLHFCEIVWEQSGRRIFDVLLEGRKVLDDFDIFAIGGHDRAVIFKYYTDVTDGQLTIEFLPEVGFTQVSAIEVIFAQPMLVEVANLFKVAHIGRGVAAALADYNRDDYADIFIANDDRANILFQNNQSGLFRNATLEAGFLRSGGGVAGAWGDYDNDGDLDLYVVRDAIGNLLYQNTGAGVFNEVARVAGVDDGGIGIACAWADYDNDGNVDLFLANEGADVLYHNKGDGSFENATRVAGVASLKKSTDAVFADVNNDGYADLLVTHYDDQIPLDNILFTSNQVGKLTPKTLLSNGLGATFSDYDNDGNLDIFMVARPNKSSSSRYHLLRNQGSGDFIDVTFVAGISDSGAAHSAGWADLDNDGDSDLYIFRENQPDLLYTNTGAGTFINIADSAGLEHHDLERAAVAGDFDNDGDPDIYVARLGKENLFYQNQGNTNNWLAVKAYGVKNNQAGIGARVRIVTGDLVQVREISGGSGFRAQNGLRQHFGLGAATFIDTLEVYWPGGMIDRFVNVDKINSIFEVVEGITTAVAVTGFHSQVIDDRVKLNWMVPEEAIRSIEIERSDTGLEYGVIATIEVARNERQPPVYEWIDKNLAVGKYFYRLNLLSRGGSIAGTAVLAVLIEPPATYRLDQNFPNPFRVGQGTQITFATPTAGHSRLEIYNLLGQQVYLFENLFKKAGYHRIRWEGRDKSGSPVSPGVYFYMIRSGEFTAMKKIVVVH